MNKLVHSTILALAVLAVLSYGVSSAYAQNATSYPRDHDHHGFFPGVGLGVRAHVGLGGLLRSPVVVGSSVVTTPSVTTTPIIHRDFDRFHNFALSHRDHFLFLNNRYIVLPGFSACPLGTQLNSLTGECQVVNQVILQQQAPIIQQEQVQVDPSTLVQAQSQTTVTTNSVAPIISCPAGSTQNGNQCQVTTESTQTVAPLLSCNAGFTLTGGQCVEQQQQIIVGQSCGCPTGSTANGVGQCVVSALPSQVTVGTVPGEIIVLGNHFHHEGSLPWLR